MAASLDPRLARFRSVLQLFPDEQAQALGPMVQRIAALVGKLSATHLHGVDPDGFDGVEQRGEYHRLLTTEWLLAEEAPDEFLRRAAMSEHLFLRLARSEPRGGRRTLVFFDAGPLQLGSPRLVHLALLLALEYRASQAGAELHWGVIQEPTSRPTSTTTDGIQQLLSSRSALLATGRAAQELLTIHQAPQPGDDIWWVGDERFVDRHDLPGSTFAVADELFLEGDRLRLTVNQGKRRRSVSLSLPPAAVRTQLMRNPFAKMREPEALLVGERNFSLSFCGEYIFLRDEVQVSILRTSAGVMHRKYPRSLDDRKLVGIARHKRDFACIYRQRGNYSLVSRSGTFRLEFSSRKPESPLGQASLWNFFVTGKSKKKVVLCDTAGTIFVGQQERDLFSLRPVLDSCQHLIWRRGHLEYVVRTADLNLEFGNLGFDLSLRSRGRGDSVRPPQVVWGFHQRGQLGATAHLVPNLTKDLASGDAKVGFHTWRIVCSDRSTMNALVRETLRVVGLLRIESGWALIVLSETRNELWLEAGKHSYVLASFPSPVQHCHMAHERARLVCQVGDKLALVDIPESGPADVRYVSVSHDSRTQAEEPK